MTIADAITTAIVYFIQGVAAGLACTGFFIPLYLLIRFDK